MEAYSHTKDCKDKLAKQFLNIFLDLNLNYNSLKNTKDVSQQFALVSKKANGILGKAQPALEGRDPSPWPIPQMISVRL